MENIGIDVNLFLALNGDLGSFMNNFMIIASSKVATLPLGLIAFYVAYKRGGWKMVLSTIIAIAVIVLIADQTCQFFKFNFSRLRPTHQPLLDGLVHTVNGYKGGLYGTVSAHAANSFGVLVFCSLLVKKRWFTTLSILFCLTIVYSRIYLGVHYPLDIMYGTIMGCATSFVVWRLYAAANNKFITKQ